MSHSSVIVIGENPEDMLAPYDENMEVEPYRVYEEGPPRNHWCWTGTAAKWSLSEDTDWPAYIKAFSSDSHDSVLLYDEELGRGYSMSTCNPQSRWDWHSLGGRWTGFFKLKANTDGGESGVAGVPGLMTPRAKPGWVDQARKRSIDFDAMRTEATKEALERIGKVMNVIAGLPSIVPWEAVREQLFPGDIDGAREFYRQQPAIQALEGANLRSFRTSPEVEYYLNEYLPTVKYALAARAGAGIPFAILDANGWHERGKMGWFGMVNDEVDNETWTAVAQGILDAADPGDLFSLYDVHI